GRVVARSGRDGARRAAGGEPNGRGRVAGAAGRAATSLVAGARDGGDPAAAGTCPTAWPARAPLLRCERVRGGARARPGGRRGGGGGGDRVRARLRGPRRPRGGRRGR